MRRILFLSFLVFLTFSCEKDKSITPENNSENFFLLKKNAGFYVEWIVEKLQKREVNKPFVKKFYRKYGLPVWSATEMFFDENGANLIIPIAKKNKVTSFWYFWQTSEGINFRVYKNNSKLITENGLSWVVDFFDYKLGYESSYSYHKNNPNKKSAQKKGFEIYEICIWSGEIVTVPSEGITYNNLVQHCWNEVVLVREAVTEIDEKVGLPGGSGGTLPPLQTNPNEVPCDELHELSPITSSNGYRATVDVLDQRVANNTDLREYATTFNIDNSGNAQAGVIQAGAFLANEMVLNINGLIDGYIHTHFSLGFSIFSGTDIYTIKQLIASESIRNTNTFSIGVVTHNRNLYILKINNLQNFNNFMSEYNSTTAVDEALFDLGFRWNLSPQEQERIFMTFLNSGDGDSGLTLFKAESSSDNLDIRPLTLMPGTNTVQEVDC